MICDGPALNGQNLSEWESLSSVWLFATAWTVARQAPLSVRFSKQEYWVAISSSRGSSQPRDGTLVSCIAGGFFYRLNQQGSPLIKIELVNEQREDREFQERN